MCEVLPLRLKKRGVAPPKARRYDILLVGPEAVTRVAREPAPLGAVSERAVVPVTGDPYAAYAVFPVCTEPQAKGCWYVLAVARAMSGWSVTATMAVRLMTIGATIALLRSQ